MSVANPFTQEGGQGNSAIDLVWERVEHVHPWIAVRMHEYHEKFHGQVICKGFLVV
jgi:hypothetical protein